MALDQMPVPAPLGWDDYFDFLLRWEGEELEDVSGDAGGLTKYGVDAASHPGVNIPALTRSAASQIHQADYRKTKADNLPFPMNYAFFDFEMNAGHAAIRALQTSCGARADGVWGIRTEQAVEVCLAQHGLPWLVLRFTEARKRFYDNLAFANPKKAKFLTGWQNRTSAMKTWCADRMRSSSSGN